MVDFLFQFGHALCESGAHIVQRLGVETHAIALHIRKDRDERHLDIVEQFLGTDLLQFWFEHVLESQCDVSILGSILIHLCRTEASHGFLRWSLWSDELLDVDGLIVE